MMYLDYSGLLKLLVEEPESVALADRIAQHPDVPAVSSELAVVEVVQGIRRLAPESVAHARTLVAQLDLVPLSSDVVPGLLTSVTRCCDPRRPPPRECPGRAGITDLVRRVRPPARSTDPPGSRPNDGGDAADSGVTRRAATGRQPLPRSAAENTMVPSAEPWTTYPVPAPAVSRSRISSRRSAAQR